MSLFEAPQNKKDAWFHRTEHIESISRVTKRPPQELTRGPQKLSFQRPEFRGPLLNATGGRKLTLQSPKFTLILALIAQCLNHYFYSVISLRRKFVTKMVSEKEGRKKSLSNKVYKKKRPPGAAN